MKLVEEKGVVERSGDFQEGVFKIAASAKAFDILSSKLYSDVPRAIIRELSTNAFDSHVSVGKADKPFKVHLPTHLERWFAIRDFGAGLSEEDVREIYTTYFASTRNTSDEFTGCLGLGSKSPFAYTDNFTVTSYFDGKANIYSLFKNEAGCPSIALLNTSDTDEPNGVEIKIDVKQYDIQAFVQAAGRVYHFFKVKPTCIGLPKEEEKTHFKGNNYKILNNNGSSYESHIQVVMGQVCYDIKDSKRNISNPFSTRYMTIQLDAEIGSCSITASREELHMDDRTVKFVEKALKNAHADAERQVKELTKQATNKLDRRIIELKYRDILSIASNANDLRWDVENEWKAFMVKVDRDRLKITNTDNYYMNNMYERPYLIRDDSPDEVLSTAQRNKIKHFINKRGPTNQQYWIVKVFDQAKVTETFGAFDTSLSLMPLPPRKVKDPSIPNTREHWILADDGYGWQRQMTWDDNKADTAIVQRNHNIILNGQRQYQTSDMRRLMQKAGIKHIYGLPPSQFKRYKGKYKSLFVILHDKLTKEISNLSDAEIACVSHHYDMSLPLNFAAKIAHMSDTLKNYHDMMKAEDDSKLHFLRNHKSEFGITFKKVPNYAEECKKQYPLLSYLHSSFFDESDHTFMNEIKAYINSKESK